MSLLSFSLNRDLIESGTKPHTIRFRQNPPRPGDLLHLWWKSRTKERDFIGVSVCQKVDPISIVASEEVVWIGDRRLAKGSITKLAKNDGFDSVKDFWKFFTEDQDGFLIWWSPREITRNQLRPEVKIFAGAISGDIAEPKPYYPSNGTEGMLFAENWCDHCDRRENCFVMMQALYSGSTRHWISHEGQPICTTFEAKDRSPSSRFAAHQYRLERRGQLNIFA